VPVVYEERQVLAGGRYLQQIRISAFPPSEDYPGGLRYSLCLVDLVENAVVLLYDIHRGKGITVTYEGKKSHTRIAAQLSS
jgi:hypothetical protein